MAAQINSFGVQQREIMMSRKSGAFVPPKVRASAETQVGGGGWGWGSVLPSLVFDPFLSSSRATLTLPFKLSTQHCPCFPFHRPFFLLTQLLNWAGKRRSRAKLGLTSHFSIRKLPMLATIQPNIHPIWIFRYNPACLSTLTAIYVSSTGFHDQ